MHPHPNHLQGLPYSYFLFLLVFSPPLFLFLFFCFYLSFFFLSHFLFKIKWAYTQPLPVEDYKYVMKRHKLKILCWNIEHRDCCVLRGIWYVLLELITLLVIQRKTCWAAFLICAFGLISKTSKRQAVTCSESFTYSKKCVIYIVIYINSRGLLILMVQ